MTIGYVAALTGRVHHLTITPDWLPICGRQAGSYGYDFYAERPDGTTLCRRCARLVERLAELAG